MSVIPTKEDENPVSLALSIIGAEPLPDDAVDQLRALEKKTPERDAHVWAWIWEGFFMASQDDGDAGLVLEDTFARKG